MTHKAVFELAPDQPILPLPEHLTALSGRPAVEQGVVRERVEAVSLEVPNHGDVEAWRLKPKVEFASGLSQ